MGWETIIYWGVVLIAGALSYTGYQKAQKAAKAAMDRQRGLVYQVRSPVASRRIIYGTQRLGGIEAFVASGTSLGPTPGGGQNNLLHYVLIWGDGPCESVRNIQLDGEDVPLVSDGGFGFVWRPVSGNKYAGHLRIEHRLGGADNNTPTGQGVIPGWANTDLLLGIAYSWVELLYDPEIFAGGIPQISAVIEGRNDIRDPRDDSTGFTDNPALCFAHYLSLQRLGPGVDFDDEIGQAELIAASNVCDEDVDGEKRYTFNGVILMEDDPEDNIQRFRSAMAGSAVYVSGQWKMYAGAYVTPTFTIGESMLVGPVKSQTKISQRDHINTVKGLYVAEDPNNWQPTDFLPVTDPAYVSADGRELVDDINLPDTNTQAMARRIASIHLERGRRTRQVSVTCNVEALRAQPGLPVIFNVPALGYINQPMDVLEWGLSITDQKLSVNLTLRETDPAIFDEPDAVTPTVFVKPVMPPVYFRRLISFRHESYLPINSPLFALVAQPDSQAYGFRVLYGETETGSYQNIATQNGYAVPMSLEQAVAASDTTIRAKLLPTTASGANPRRTSSLITDWTGTTTDGSNDRLLLILIAKDGGGTITSQEICSVNGAPSEVSTDVYDIPVRRGRRWSSATAFSTGSFPDAFSSYEVWVVLRDQLPALWHNDWYPNVFTHVRPTIYIRYTPIGLGKVYDGETAFAEYERRTDESEELAEFEFQTDETHQPTDEFSWPDYEDENTYANMIALFDATNVSVKYKTRGGNMDVRGFGRYTGVDTGTAETLYRRIEPVGSESWIGYGTDATCTTPDGNSGGSSASGYKQIPRLGAATPGSIPGTKTNITDACATVAYTDTTKTITHDASCCNVGGGNYLKRSGGSVETMSDPDLESDAIERLQNSLDASGSAWTDLTWNNCVSFPCGLSKYVIRTTTSLVSPAQPNNESIYLSQARYDEGMHLVHGEGFGAGAYVITLVPIGWRAAGTSDPITLKETQVFTGYADGSGVLEFTFDLPNERGYEHCVLSSPTFRGLR